MVSILWVCLEVENWGHGVMIGRPDQYLYPYFKNDKANGRITDAEATELIEMLYIKLNATVSLDDFKTATVFAGFPQIVNVVLGGQDKDGADAVNELSYIFLEAERYTRLPMEDLVVRVNNDTPRAFLMKAVEVAIELNGKIKFIGDNVHIEQLLHDGYSLEQARDFVVTGCNSPCVQGVSLDVPGGIFNMPFMLELALNNGVVRLTGKQVGLATGDPRKFQSYDEIWEAFAKQLEYFVDAAITMTNVDRMLFARNTPTPFQSALFNGPIENGIEIMNGGTGKFARHAISMAGAPNVGDSMAAIKKCVFEDQTLTMGRLIDALDANFDGYEDVRYRLQKAPKFGNDEDYVDKIVDEALILASGFVTSRNNYVGNPMNMAAAAITANVPHGYILGALPDGRLAGTPISEGGISPQQGRNVSGPTATLRSVSKLHHNSYTNGCVLNMRFNPASLKDDCGKNKFVDMLYAYFTTGGPFVQFNIVDTDTLRNAQLYPEKHQDLLVRIATYTAYFVELSPDMQNDIIARMELEV
jgi:formate C-acetyltransferase